jgi:hypothetical protein
MFFSDPNNYKYYGVSWPQFNKTDSSGTQKYMQIDKRWKVIDEPFTDAIRFWDSLRV